MEITNWFNDRVVELSPSKENGASVAKGQMQRIVQLLKFFTKSRDSWQESGKTLPGGLIVSTLVGDINYCYRPDATSDEKALYYTIEAIVLRLKTNLEVKNPVDNTQSLTYKDEYKNQVKRFKEKLEKALEWLDPLLNTVSDKESEAKAWEEFFKHKYWEELVKQIEEAKSYGEALKTSSFVTSAGKVTPTPPTEKYIKVPAHKYYGKE